MGSLQKFDNGKIQMIIQTALNGEHARGDNGAVLIDEETSELVYLLSHEFKPVQFSEQLNDLLSEDKRVHIFVVLKTKDAMHISKLPRS
jgi:hypothetical protein